MDGLRRREAGGLSYLEAGKGPPLVLLHGIPGSAHAWEGVGARLAGHFRVIIPDLAGFGRSTPPEGDYYMEEQSRRLSGLLRLLGVQSLFLGGHDFGGPVALTLHRQHPEFTLRGLILSATNLFTDTHVPPPLRLARVPLIGSAFFRLAAGNRIGLGLMYRAATVQRQRATWAMFRRHLTRSGMAMTHKIFRRSLADLDTNYRPIQEMLARISVPTLILWGDRDPFFATAVAERSHRAIPGSDLRIFPETGHFVPEEQPEPVAAAILAWCAGLGQTAPPRG